MQYFVFDRRNALVGVLDKHSEFAKRAIHEWTAQVFRDEAGDSLRALPRMASVPVVVLTGSSSPQDASLAYEHAASAFVSKNLDIGQVLARNAMYCDFWDALLPDRRELAPETDA